MRKFFFVRSKGGCDRRRSVDQNDRTLDDSKQAVNEIDDYLYDELKTARGIELSLDQMDDIIEKVLQVAKHRSYK